MTSPRPNEGAIRRLTASLLATPRAFLRRLGLAWAAALTYHSLLALVPLTIIAFSLLGVLDEAIGFETELQDFLIARGLPDAAAQVGEIVRDLVSRARNDAGAMSAIGVGILVILSISFFSALEKACNELFGVTRGRRPLLRLRALLTLGLFGPTLVGASIFVTAALQRFAIERAEDVWGTVLGPVVIVSPLIVTWLAFYCIIAFVPHTRVSWGSALLGAVISGTVWESAKWGFGLYVTHAGSIDALYGPLALLPLFIIWTHLTWIIFLVGVTLAGIHHDRKTNAATDTDAAADPGG